MPTIDPLRLTIRPTGSDLQHLEAIAGAPGATGGMPFATKTDAVRHALPATAAAMTGQGAAQ